MLVAGSLGLLMSLFLFLESAVLVSVALFVGRTRATACHPHGWSNTTTLILDTDYLTSSMASRDVDAAKEKEFLQLLKPCTHENGEPIEYARWNLGLRVHLHSTTGILGFIVYHCVWLYV
jgi:hypothetical protein